MSDKWLDFDAQIKADVGADTGTFSAYVSVFGNVDRVGDRVMPGAFAKSLETWRASGRKMPLQWAHQGRSPKDIIGYVDPHNMTEDEKGLRIDGAVLNVKSNSDAAYVHELMKQGVVNQFSFRYNVPKGGQRRAKGGINELTELELFEVGPCPAGVNPATELVSVKADDGEKAGARHSTATLSELRAIRDRITALIGDGEPEAPKADDVAEAKADDVIEEESARDTDEPEAPPDAEPDSRERNAREIERQLQDVERQRVFGLRS